MVVVLYLTGHPREPGDEPQRHLADYISSSQYPVAHPAVPAVPEVVVVLVALVALVVLVDLGVLGAFEVSQSKAACAERSVQKTVGCELGRQEQNQEQGQPVQPPMT